MKPTTVQSKPKNISSLSVWLGIAIVCVVLNVLFLLFIDNLTKTIALLKKEAVQLKQQEKLISSAKDLTTTYKTEIELVSSVFPEENTIPLFIKVLENEVASYSAEYSVKFDAVTPLQEQDRLLLPLTITFRADLTGLMDFLSHLEKLPYMTHVIGLSAKSPDGITNTSEVVVNLKVYVKDPFTQ